jgi:nucleoside-diphosphate-sugar epimerase
MTVLVTGATGFIGQHLVTRLRGSECRIRVLTRKASRVPADWPGRVEIVAGDLLDTDSIRGALRGVTTVVNLAGVITDPLRMRAVNVEGVRLLAEVAAKEGVSRLVHVSSAGVVGQPDTEMVTEDTPCRPENLYERSKLEGEQALLAQAKSSGLDVVIVRPTNVFGEGRDPSRDSLLEWMTAIRKGRFVYFGSGGMANYVYVGDVAEALYRVVEGPSRGPVVVFVADPAPLRDFVRAMAETMAVTPPQRHLPAWAGYTIAGLMEAGRRFGLPAPLTFARVRALTNRHVYPAYRFRQDYPNFLPLGYREGLKRTVEWYRKTEVGLYK